MVPSAIAVVAEQSVALQHSSTSLMASQPHCNSPSATSNFARWIFVLNPLICRFVLRIRKADAAHYKMPLLNFSSSRKSPPNPRMIPLCNFLEFFFQLPCAALLRRAHTAADDLQREIRLGSVEIKFASRGCCLIINLRSVYRALLKSGPQVW